MTWVRVLVVWVVAAVVVAAVHHAAKTFTARRRPWSWPQEQAWQEVMNAHAMAAWDRPIPGDDTVHRALTDPYSGRVARLLDEGDDEL